MEIKYLIDNETIDNKIMSESLYGKMPLHIQRETAAQIEMLDRRPDCIIHYFEKTDQGILFTLQDKDYYEGC